MASQLATSFLTSASSTSTACASGVHPWVRSPSACSLFPMMSKSPALSPVIRICSKRRTAGR
jgi:hypothetical protein